MNKLFYASALALTLFEIANVYFIMPMPGSQQMNTVELAYFLYHWRWVFRVVLGLTAVWAWWKGHFKYKWMPWVLAAIWAIITWQFNFSMTADKMFLQPALTTVTAADSQVDTGRIALCIAINNDACAYPIQYLAYHHQVLDSVGGKQIMVTYCNVCRSGRMFNPFVNGERETFRLVGMDHFNAMFEDSRTHSWWRQENGECVAGPLRGQWLPELRCDQMSIGQWTALHPNTRVMQPDTVYNEEYKHQDQFETGKKKGALTGTDSLSWHEKSWVVGITAGEDSKAFDWNELVSKRVLNDYVGSTPIVLALSDDNKSFAAFVRPGEMVFSIQNDTLVTSRGRYNLKGRALHTAGVDLDPVPASQEFWHSWRTFHPE